MKRIFAASLHYFRFRSIQQKFGIYAFILSLLATAGVSYFSYGIARNQVQRDREQLMEAEAQKISENLRNEINNTVEDLKLWREIDSIRNSLKQGPNEQANAFFDDLVEQRKEYDLIFTIDLQDRICAIDSVGAQFVGKPINDLLVNPPGSWLVDTVKSGSVQKIDWQQFPVVNALFSRKPASTPLEKQYQIAFGIAVYELDMQSPLGVIVAVLNWSHFQSVLDSTEMRFKSLDLTTGYAFLLANDAETAIGHKYRRVQYGKSIIKKDKLYGLHERARDNPSGTYAYKWIEGDKIVALARVLVPEVHPQIDWRLGVGINNDDIFAPVQKLKLWFFLISLVIAASVACLSILLGRRVSVSIQEFEQLARDASQGRFVITAKAHSHDELGSLAQAFNEMLVSFRSQLPFAGIPNPYVVGTPVRTSSMFYGRHEDLDWIGHHLEHASNIMILLFGARRVGKTSLLHQIYGERTSAKILPFFFDTQQIIPELTEDGDFYNVLTRELLAQVPEKLPGSKAPFIAAERFTPQTFRNLLKFLNDAEPDKIPILLFDELENLEYKLARGQLSSDVFLFLAGLLDSDICVSFVATGSEELEAKRYPDWNILVPKTLSRRIGMLTPKDTLRLIEEPVHGYLVYEEGIPARILRMTSGHPYYTQIICQTLVDLLNQSREFKVGEDQLDKVVQTVLNNPPPPLSHVWERFTLPEKIASTVTAHLIENENDYIQVDRVRESVPVDLKFKLDDTLWLHSSLDHLSREDWMERSEEGNYRFRVDLFRLWVRREHTIWHLADEIQQSIDQ